MTTADKFFVAGLFLMAIYLFATWVGLVAKMISERRRDR